MEHITVSGTGIRMSRVALGTWAIGGSLWGGSDTFESIRTILAALSMGVNTIDTAPVYGLGRSEEIVGQALKMHGHRDRIVISTKAGLEWDEHGKVHRNAGKESIIEGVEGSLRRLGTDYIDIYCVHWPDPLVPYEETAEAMSTLHRQGKIRTVGLSNFSPGEMDNFRKASPLHIVQPPYNLFERAVESDILPYCSRQGLTTMAYGSLCRGLLSGQTAPDSRFYGDDLRRFDPEVPAAALRGVPRGGVPPGRFRRRAIRQVRAGSGRALGS
jgi:aryl-alcohol dehydrogenase-like predicted oxidoreductase